MTMMNKPEAVCHTCGKPHPFEDGTVPKHPFNDGTLSMSETFGKKLPDGSRALPGQLESTPVEAQWPFDPVLRQALIDKGVLTPQDLTEAEAKIRSVTGQMMGVVNK